MKGERILLRRDDVLVTSARFVVPGKTYAMSNITSVGAFVLPPDNSVSNALLIVGAITALLGIGLVLILIAIILRFFSRPRHCLRIRTAGVEDSELVGEDQVLIDEVAKAVNEAIISRG